MTVSEKLVLMLFVVFAILVVMPVHADPFDDSMFPLLNGTRQYTGTANMGNHGIKNVTYISGGSFPPPGYLLINGSSATSGLAGVIWMNPVGGYVRIGREDFPSPGTALGIKRVPQFALDVDGDINVKSATGGRVLNVTTYDDKDAVNKSYMIEQINSSPSNGGTDTYTLLVQALSSNPTDNSYNYIGALPKTVSTTAQRNRVYIPKSGTITAAEISVYADTAGTNEPWTCSVLVNNVANPSTCGISTVSLSTNQRTFENRAMTCVVNAGDYVEVRFENPAWVKNPAAAVYGGHLLVQSS